MYFEVDSSHLASDHLMRSLKAFPISVITAKWQTMAELFRGQSRAVADVATALIQSGAESSERASLGLSRADCPPLVWLMRKVPLTWENRAC